MATASPHVSPERVQLHESGLGKFVQIDIYENGDKFPVFASKGIPCFHAQVVSELLDSFDISYRSYTKGTDLGEINVPVSLGERYKVVGAGECNSKKGIFTLDRINSSVDYSMGYSPEHLKQIIPFFPKGIEVRVK